MAGSAEALDEQLAAFVEFLHSQPDVLLAYLFGSHARGQPRPKSDVDVALLLEEEGRTPLEMLERRLDLAAQAEELVYRPVDVVLLNNASLLLQGEVLREGRLLYSIDKAIQVDYEARARGVYFDFQYRLRQQHEGLMQRMKEGISGNH